MQHSRLSAAILGTALAIGLIGAGAMLADAVIRFKTMDRYVSVKGLAQREVPANLAIWPLSFNVNGNDLMQVQEQLARNMEIIETYLAEQGFESEEVGRAAPQITDYQAQGYSGGNVPLARYSAKGSVTVHTSKVQSVVAAMAASAELVSRGVVLIQDWERRSQFFFTGLNDIKPEMIAEATRNARAAASQFAHDSGSDVGTIRRANQGLFSISDRDPNTPQIKKVRVVTTVDYFLED